MAVAKASIKVQFKKQNSNRGRLDDAPAPYPLGVTVTNYKCDVCHSGREGGGVLLRDE